MGLSREGWNGKVIKLYETKQMQSKKIIKKVKKREFLLYFSVKEPLLAKKYPKRLYRKNEPQARKMGRVLSA